MFNFRVFKNAVQSLIRNKWLTFATISVMTLTLFTVSVFVILNILIGSTIDTIKSRIDLEVYFKSSVTEDEILDIKSVVERESEVKDAKYISKDEAFKIFKERNQDTPELYQTISDTDNPLPASLKINLTKAENLDKVNSMFRGGKYDSFVEDTSYENNKNVVNKLISFGNYVNKGGIFLCLIFVITSLIVVLNTIRMTIYTRREEIEIMRLVGATNWYIRWPFILEGAFYGLISMLFASIAVIAGLKFANPYIVDYFQEFGKNFFDSLATYGLIIIAWQFAVSIFVGVVSASLAIGKHLRS